MERAKTRLETRQLPNIADYDRQITVGVILQVTMLNVSDFSRPSARDNVSGMSTTDQLTARLSAFKTKFSDFVSKNTGRRHAGYDELNQGLMAGEGNDDSRTYGGGSGGYQGPVPGYEAGAPTSGGVASERAPAAQSHVPSQVSIQYASDIPKSESALSRLCCSNIFGIAPVGARSGIVCLACDDQDWKLCQMYPTGDCIAQCDSMCCASWR